MTRKSKRELERAADELAGGEDADPVTEWVDQHSEEIDGFEITYGAPIGECGECDDEVCIWRSQTFESWIQKSEIPDWIDVEADLPVER